MTNMWKSVRNDASLRHESMGPERWTVNLAKRNHDNALIVVQRLIRGSDGSESPMPLGNSEQSVMTAHRPRIKEPRQIGLPIRVQIHCVFVTRTEPKKAR